MHGTIPLALPVGLAKLTDQSMVPYLLANFNLLQCQTQSMNMMFNQYLKFKHQFPKVRYDHPRS